MFMISQAFSYSSGSSFQQTVVYLCSINVSLSSRSTSQYSNNDVRKRRNTVVFFNVFKNFLKYVFKKSFFAIF